MTDVQISDLLLGLSALLGLSYLVTGLLSRLRIPGILGALLVAMTVKVTILGQFLLSPDFNQAFVFLAQLGVLFLLFFIGLQIDLKEMVGLGRDIVWLTVLKVVLTFVTVFALMVWRGYGYLLAVIVSLIRIPTAEAVIVPILDEFRLIRTRVGEIIIGTSILDDVIEVSMVTLVSIWLSGQLASHWVDNLSSLAIRSLVFLAVAAFSYRWLVPPLSRWLPRRPSHLVLLAMFTLFSFCGLSEWSGLGMVLGALAAGVVARPSFDQLGLSGEQARLVIQSISYGFLAQIFFFWVGLNVDLAGLADAPTLTVLLVVSAVLAKLLSVLIMVPLHRINLREGWIIGVSVNAGLTTEIIVAQLMLNAHRIDVHLFTALVAASSVSTIGVPLILAVILHHWRDQVSV